MVINSDKWFFVTTCVTRLFDLRSFYGNHLDQNFNSDKIPLLLKYHWKAYFGLVHIFKRFMTLVLEFDCSCSRKHFKKLLTLYEAIHELWTSYDFNIAMNLYSISCTSGAFNGAFKPSLVFLHTFTELPHHCSQSLTICLSAYMYVESVLDIITSANFTFPFLRPPQQPIENMALQ